MNTKSVSIPSPSRKLQTSFRERPKLSILGAITCDAKTGVKGMISLHLPKLLLHALPGAIASAQLHLLKLLPKSVPLKLGPLRMFWESEGRKKAPPLISWMLDAWLSPPQSLSSHSPCMAFLRIWKPWKKLLKLDLTETLKLTCTQQLQHHLVRHLPGQRRSLHLPAPHSTSAFPEAPPPGCTLQSKMGRWSPPEQNPTWKLKAEVSSSPCSPEGFQGQRQSLCSPLRNCKNVTILYFLKLQTIYLNLKRSYDLFGGNSVLTNNLYWTYLGKQNIF